ncbi:hypothetical protein SAMN05216201_11179 [Pseudomonas linyingensis]|uniref:Uncharacterized protein n=1 Tax=Pseudomonas linyingensis TaxID=915471 RepID=A0A1H6ZXA8_9PSED|nr:hypothetical protein [Pseudomonas linyingensis]SEJ58109.1 hypothetical protein SAMN05216201_11179 [Pseudomonas linyingensis]
MTIRKYHSSDPGAPAVNQASWFQTFRAVLRACLVDGYGAGSSPPAGWSLIYDNTNGIVLKSNGVAPAYFNFQAYSPTGSNNTYGYMQCLIGASCDSVNASGLMSGDGVRSGNVTNQQRIPLRAAFAGTTWTLLADERTFVFYANSNDLNNFQGSQSIVMLYCGDDASNRSIVIGGALSSSASSALYNRFHSGGCAGSALRDPESGLLLDSVGGSLVSVALDVGSAANGSSWGMPYSGGLDELPLYPCYWLYGDTLVGRLRGLCLSPIAIYSESTLLKALGLSPSLVTRGAWAQLGEHHYAGGISGNYSPSLVLTTNPAYW